MIKSSIHEIIRFISSDEWPRIVLEDEKSNKRSVETREWTPDKQKETILKLKIKTMVTRMTTTLMTKMTPDRFIEMDGA